MSEDTKSLNPIVEEVQNFLEEYKKTIRTSNIELVDKITQTARITRLENIIIESLKKSISAETNGVSENDIKPIVDLNDRTEILNESLDTYYKLRRKLSSIIPSNIVDRKVISINRPALEEQIGINSFDNSKQTVLFVFSTGSEAYVVSKTASGRLMASPSKFWSMSRS